MRKVPSRTDSGTLSNTERGRPCSHPSDHRCVLSLARTSCAVMRPLLPEVRTLPSSTWATFSRFAISAISIFSPLHVRERQDCERILVGKGCRLRRRCSNSQSCRIVRRGGHIARPVVAPEDAAAQQEQQRDDGDLGAPEALLAAVAVVPREDEQNPNPVQIAP